MNRAPAWRRAGRLLPLACLLLSSCGGLGGYVSDTFWRAGNPHAPQGNALTLDRARGEEVSAPVILPIQGNIWPNAAARVPSLADVERSMNGPGSTSQTYSAQGYQGQGYQGQPPKHARNGRLPPSASPATLTPPINQSGVAMTPRIRPARPVAPPVAAATSPFRLGDTVMTPNGPGGVVSSDNAGGYQTVAPIGGQGGGILVPSGNGAATLIGPNGQVSPVIAPRH